MADQNHLEDALTAASDEPHNEEHWDRLEELASTHDCPDVVITAYQKALQQELPASAIGMIGKRAMHFHEEWFGDDSAGLMQILARVLELDTSADWAFERLTVELTTAERWDDLLHAYDRSIAGVQDEERRIQLLEEASQVAKDVANIPKKAIEYLQQLLPYKQNDANLSVTLERLLERDGQWEKLVELWTARSQDRRDPDRLSLLEKIAVTFLDQLKQPDKALGFLRVILQETAQDDRVCELIERVLFSPLASESVHKDALELLRSHYHATKRPQEIVRVLRTSIDNAGSAPVHSLHEEAGKLLADMGADSAAMEHYNALLALDPDSVSAQEQLFQIATRSKNYALYADGIFTAAQNSTDVARKVELWVEAARVRVEFLDDHEGAISAYRLAMDQNGIGQEEVRNVANKLNALYVAMEEPQQRLEILVKLVDLETDPVLRAATIADAAGLAESLGKVEEAVSLWRMCLAERPQDSAALRATIQLLEDTCQWHDLIEVLQQRVVQTESDEERRADLIWIAKLYQNELQAFDEAIRVWLQVQTTYGENFETVQPLIELYSATGKWTELAGLLARTSAEETKVVCSRYVRLADTQRQYLDDVNSAVRNYSSALRIDPSHEEARAGLIALLEYDTCRPLAVEELLTAYRVTRDWANFAALVPARLEVAVDEADRLQILREAATIIENDVEDMPGAFRLLAQAFPMAPTDRGLEARLNFLAEETGSSQQLAQAYANAMTKVQDPHEVARLQLQYAMIVELQLEQPEQAFGEYVSVHKVQPSNLVAAQGVVRLGTRLARWEDGARALVSCFGARGVLEESLLTDVESAAKELGAVDDYFEAMSAMVVDADLPTWIRVDLHGRLAYWAKDQCNNPALAIKEFQRVLILSPTRVDVLHELVILQRPDADQSFLATLLKASNIDSSNLDLVFETAEVATKIADNSDIIRDAFVNLMRCATAIWQGSVPNSSTRVPQECIAWAADRLVVHYCKEQTPAAAVEILLECARLPFPMQDRNQYRSAAAQIAVEQLGDYSTAIEMYRGILAGDPNNSDAFTRLSELYEQEQRFAELLFLRRHQLNQGAAPEDRLHLRLDVARLAGEVERRSGRLEVLLENLKEEPGHAESVEAVCTLLSDKNAYQELTSLLEQQAAVLESTARPEQAAVMWEKIAGIAEHNLHDLEKAMEGHRRVMSLAYSSDSLAALARLYSQTEQPAQAIVWLEQAMHKVPLERQEGIVFSLAQAYIGAGIPDKAIACIERYMSEYPLQPPLRTLLAEQYRVLQRWEPLGELLTNMIPLLGDEQAKVALAREVVGIYNEQLDQPDRAIPALEAVLEIVPEDRGLRLVLVKGLRVANQFEKARLHLQTLLEQFGRRRSVERAQVHVELALVAQAERNMEEAQEQAELAAQLDSGNPSVLKMAADLALDNGKPEEAERRYRALLLVVRRQSPERDDHAVGASEVLYALYLITSERGDELQAQEILESTFEAAIQSDAEIRRFRRTLLAHQDSVRLLEVLRARLEVSEEKDSRAWLLVTIAEVLDNMDRSSEALDAQLQALKLAPCRQEVLRCARHLAKKCNRTQEYVDSVQANIASLAEVAGPISVAQLQMNVGVVLEQDIQDFEAALDIYQQVEQSGHCLSEAYYAIARVARSLGDQGEHTRALDCLLEIATNAEHPAGEQGASDQIDALYRVAAVLIESEERRSQGLDLLEKGFQAEPRYTSAQKVLCAAMDQQPQDVRAMSLYERVARGSGDAVMLLDFLERRAYLPSSTPEQVKEAVDLANRIGQRERGEALLARAVDAARTAGEGLGGVIWAVCGLAEQRAKGGDVEAANALFEEIAALAPAETVFDLGLSIAKQASQTKNGRNLAIEIYEFLRERDPADRRAWEPLMDLYRQLGATESLEQVVHNTLPTLVDASSRNAMRLQYAAYLLDCGQSVEPACQVLRDVLLDDPDHREAAALLENVLRDAGDDQGLADFFWQRFEDAKRRNNPETVVDVARRLGALLEELGSEEVIDVYRSALDIAPEEPTLLRAILKQRDLLSDQREKEMLLERLLHQAEKEEVQLVALDLCALREEMNDNVGAQQALEIGFQKDSHNDELRQKLQQWYRTHQQWNPLAAMIAVQASDAEDPTIAVSLFREAATIYRDQLNDFDTAADVLKQAVKVNYDSASIVPELVECLLSTEKLAEAIHVLDIVLDNELEDLERVQLLLLRSNVRMRNGESQQALADLEQAYDIDSLSVRPQLIATLERQRIEAQENSQRDWQRRVTLRLVDLLGEDHSPERARELLLEWTELEPHDSDALQQMRDMDNKLEHWEGVIAACARLVVVEQGQSQIDNVLMLVDASQRAERPGAAQQGLEVVHAAQPDNVVVRDKLRQIYEQSGAHRQLASLLLSDGDHGTDDDERFDAYRKASLLFLNALNDSESAIDPAQKAHALRPNEHDAVLLYVDALSADGRLGDAMEVLEPAIAAHKRRSPQLAALQLRMARMAAAQGDRDNQLIWLKKSFDVDRKNGQIAAELAELATEMGDYDLALKPLRAITLMDDPGPITRVMALLWEAKIEHARGNRAKAELWAKKALREDPNFEEAQQFLTEIAN